MSSVSADLSLQTRARRLADELETVATTGMFGDGASIAATAAVYYAGSARMLASVLGIDGDQIAPHPVPHVESLRRSMIDRALSSVFAGDKAAAAEEIAAYTPLHQLAGSPDAQADAAAWTAEGEPTFMSAWVADPLADRIITTFNDGMAQHKDGSAVVPVDPTPEERETFDVGLGLMRRAVPRLTADVLAAVPALALFDGPLVSGYSAATPLFVFVNRKTFDDPVEGAEMMQHECLHQKLNDIGIARSLFRADYDDDRSAKITVPWGRPGTPLPRHFSADRTFAAFHVYSHQALLHLGMLACAKDGEEAEAAVELLSVSWARAAHFDLPSQAEDIQAELGADGRRLIQWLSALVARLGEFEIYPGEQLSSRRGAVYDRHMPETV